MTIKYKHPAKKVEVTVSITLSKNLFIEVNDYSEQALKKAVESQVTLPSKAWKHIDKTLLKEKKDLKSWIVDDFEVIKE